MSNWTEEEFYGVDTGPHSLRLVHESGRIFADAATGVVFGYEDADVLAAAIEAGDIVVDGRNMVAVP